MDLKEITPNQKTFAVASLFLFGAILFLGDIFRFGAGVTPTLSLAPSMTETAAVSDSLNSPSVQNLQSLLNQLSNDIATLPSDSASVPNSSLNTTASSPGILTLGSVNAQNAWSHTNPDLLWAVFSNTLDTTGSSTITVPVNYSGATPVTYTGVSGLSAPFSFAGGSYPGVGGTCGATIGADCTIVLSFMPRGESPLLEGGNGTPGSKGYEANFSLDYGASSSTAPILLAAHSVLFFPTADFTLPSTENFGTLAVGDRLTQTLGIQVKNGSPLTGYGTVTNATMQNNNPDPAFTISAEPNTGCDFKDKIIGYICTFDVTYAPTAVGNDSTDLSFSYFNGVTQKTVTTRIVASAVATPARAVDPAKNLLIVYNSAVPESVQVKNYYIKNRPGFSAANVLGISAPIVGPCTPQQLKLLNAPDCSGLTAPTNTVAEIADPTVYEQNIRQPILDWIHAHPEKDIHYIVLVRGVPNRVLWSDGESGKLLYFAGLDTLINVTTSLSNDLAQATDDPSCAGEEFWPIRNGAPLGNTMSGSPALGADCPTPTAPAVNGYFTPQGFPGTVALITVLDMGDLNDTLAYIDKLAATYKKMAHPNVVISGSDAGVGGDTYDFEDIRNSTYSSAPTATSSAQAVLAVNPNANVIYHDGVVTGFPEDVYTTAVNHASNVTGYMTWGYNGGRGCCFAFASTDTPPYAPTALKMNFSGNSGWYIMTTLDSFNGVWNDTTAGNYQGSYRSWFLPNSFGGTNYEYTPVGAVATVDEPYLVGKNSPDYFSCWEQGRMFADCAWISRNSPTMIALGDPWVTK